MTGLPTHESCPKCGTTMSWAFVDFSDESEQESGLMLICPRCYLSKDGDLHGAESDAMRPFADAIRAARTAKRMSLKIAADKFGMSVSDWSAVERAIRRLDRCTAERMAAIVGLATEETQSLLDDVSYLLVTPSRSSATPTSPDAPASSTD